MTAEEIEQIEISKELANKAIAKGEALKRLLSNPDYISVISEGFFKEYPRELAEAIANNTGSYDTNVLIKNLESINTLKGYEFRVANNYSAGIQSLNEIEEYIANSVNETEEE